MVTGIIGVVLGAEASRRYKKVNPRAEPLICACSLLIAAPCLYLALILAPVTLLASYVSEGPWGGGGGLVCRSHSHGLILRPVSTSVYHSSRGALGIPILQMCKLRFTRSSRAGKEQNWDLSLSPSDSRVCPLSRWLTLWLETVGLVHSSRML